MTTHLQPLSSQRIWAQLPGAVAAAPPLLGSTWAHRDWNLAFRGQSGWLGLGGAQECGGGGHL